MILFQKKLKNNFDYLNFFLITFLIISFPFNKELFFSLRPNDLICITLILFNIKLLSYKNYLLIFGIFLTFTISNVLGFQGLENFYFIKFVFYYKILVTIFLFFILSKIFENLSEDQIDKIYLLIKYTFNFFIFLIILIYILDLSLSNQKGYPKFFFSETNDTHILANVIFTFIFFEIIYNKKKKLDYKFLFSPSFNFLLINFLIISILYFYSASTFYYIAFISLVLLNLLIDKTPYLNKILNFKFIKRYFLILYMIIFSTLCIFVFANIIKIFIDYSLIHEIVFIRDFILLGNQLEFGWFDVRIINWVNYFTVFEFKTLFFGFGFLNQSQIFFDSYLIFLYSSVGIFGLMFILFIVFKSIDKEIIQDTNFLLFIICIVGANFFITEFILISRYSLITVFMISLYYAKFYKT